MAAALLLILGLIFLGLALLKRYGLAARVQGRSVRYATGRRPCRLGARKQLVVVRFLNKLLVLGVTDSGINLITEADHVPDGKQSSFFEALEREREVDSPSE
jgi:flagellar protein FliO/FliZ